MRRDGDGGAIGARRADPPGEQTLHGAQSCLQPPATFCQWDADGLELGGVLTADADTHPEPARSEAHQRPELLRQHNGVPQRQQHDARAQRGPVGSMPRPPTA